MTARILLATRSQGKLRELIPLFADAGFEPMTLDAAGIPKSAAEEHLEEFPTFEENALAKARYFFPRAGGLAVVADDSGLEVAHLDGAPGVRTKRWSGRADLTGQRLDDENNATLQRALTGAPDRSARYVCVAAYVDATGTRIARGESAGHILDAPRGSGGFGYDPYFYSDELGVTFAEAARKDKERVSHRGRAFARLLAEIARR